MIEKKPINSMAQAATELAVFGAILIFLIGAIVRTTTSNSYQQNQQLKTMRQALLNSYRGSKANTVGRNSASIIYIQDRLSPDIAKYGPTERIQLVAQSTATMSNMLLFPVEPSDLADPRNLPLMDIYINNDHFVFSTARYVTKEVPSPTLGYNKFYPKFPIDITFAHPKSAPPDGFSRLNGWEFECVEGKDGSGNDVWFGCPLFYQVIANKEGSGFCDTEPCGGSLSLKERFDLNRNGDFSDDAPETASPGDERIERKDMAWQWTAVRAIADNIPKPSVGNYPTYDVDGDGQEEILYDYEADERGVITRVSVLDFQDGDIYPGDDDETKPVLPGLNNNMAIYTRTKDGTFFEIREGKLYNPESGNYVRTANFTDQAEVVQRIIQLSNDTGTFSGMKDQLDGSRNPVESVSTDCFSVVNIDRTCYDPETKRIYSRSRIQDRRGHVWKTEAKTRLE